MFFDTEMTPFLTPLGCLKWYPHLGPFWGIPPYMVKPLYGSQKQGPKLPLSPLPPPSVSKGTFRAKSRVLFWYTIVRLGPFGDYG